MQQSRLTAPGAQRYAYAQFQSDAKDTAANQLSRHAYRVLPKVFRPIQKKIKVRVISQQELGQVLLYGKGDATGSYKKLPDSGLFAGTKGVLTVTGGRPVDAMRNTMLHEFAHHIYQEEMYAPYRQQWEKLWEAELRRSTLPTPYASTNASEGFAESFACWVLTSTRYRLPSTPLIRSNKLSKENRIFFYGLKGYIAKRYGLETAKTAAAPATSAGRQTRTRTHSGNNGQMKTTGTARLTEPR